MKKTLSVLSAVLSLVSSAAFAGESWVPANGKQCNAVCSGKNKPVTLGEIAGNKESFVCSGEGMPADTTKDKGFRAGFTTLSDGELGCALYSGNGGRIPSKFMCLCVSE